MASMSGNNSPEVSSNPCISNSDTTNNKETNHSPIMPPTDCISQIYSSPTQPPNTDNLLDISVPKITLLGKEQAKKRLYAFSASKQSISPNCKKSKLKCEDKTDSETKKPKKGPNPGEKAKAVIEEIEEIKKIEHAYYEAIEQGLLDTRKEWKRHHRKGHRRSSSSENVRSRSSGKEKYPESWSEIKKKGYDQEKLADMKLSLFKKCEECLDFRKQFLFETPCQLLHPFVYKDTLGKEKTVSILSRRVTQTKPKISFSVTGKVENSAIYNRKYLLEYVPKSYRENILNIATPSSRPLETISSKPTRRWYPKTVFSNVEKETECTVLENSLGLSFLQNYSDEEEQDKDETKLTDKCVTKKLKRKKEMSSCKKVKDEKRKQKKKDKTQKTKKMNEKMEKDKKKAKGQREEVDVTFEKLSKTEKPVLDSKCKKSNHSEEFPRKKAKKGNESEKIENEPSKKSMSKIKHKHHTKIDKTHEKESKDEKSPVPVVDKDNRQDKSERTSTKSYTRDKKHSAEEESKTTKVIEKELDTPDTDEYYSNWESEEEVLNSSTSKQSDLYTDTSGVNVSWESETDIPLSKSPVRQFYQSETPCKEGADFSPFRDRFINERRRSRCSMDNPSPPFLEMPLNIRNYRKVSWQEERHNSERINFRNQSDQKNYSLYAEDSWEKDDYMTIKSEELRLEEERRTLMEERRQLEIEKRKLEELERERYYFRRTNPEEYNDVHLASDERQRHKNYHYHREGELERGSKRSNSETASENDNSRLTEEHEKKLQTVPSKRKKSRWQDIDASELEVKQLDVSKEDWECAFSDKLSEQNKIGKELEKQKPEVLENEYEKFMKALNSQNAKEKLPTEKKSRKVVKRKTVKSSSSSSSSSSSVDSDSSSTSTSSSSSSCKKRKKLRKKSSIKKKKIIPIKKLENKQVIKLEDVERSIFEKENEVNTPSVEIPLPKLETIAEHKTIPLPVPSPKVEPFVLNIKPTDPDSMSVIPNLTLSPIKSEDCQREKDTTPKKNNIIPIKFLTPELRKLAHETTLTNEIGTITAISSPLQIDLEYQTCNIQSPLKNMINDFEISIKTEEEVTTSVESVVIKSEAGTKKSNFKEVINIDDLSIPSRDSSSCSTKRDNSLLKSNDGTPKTEDTSIKYNASSKRKKEKKDSENTSPPADAHRKLSSNQLNHFAINKCTKTEKENLQRISSAEKCTNLSKASPLSSPLDGFKRSVADSTISDDQLLQSNLVECTESPNVYKNPVERSPRRMSLDERINQALGLSEEPKPIATTYSGNCNFEPQYYEECYDGYTEEAKKPHVITKRYQRSNRENSKLKVLQVGNILQVVPTEDYSKLPVVPPEKKTPVQQNKVSNSTQKILQVGNMLQIVPTTSFPENFEIESTEPAPVTVSAMSTPIKNAFNAEMLIKQKAERRAEKDKRKQERQLKRKEKEKKRKERERRKQLKVKLQTEAMIKQALILEDNSIDEQQLSEPQKPAQWPPMPQIISNCSYRPPGKGILSQRREERGESFDKRKQVQFSDGIRPGEGTSPSGGEELSSPPPTPRKLPKEKRFRKIKPPKKEKVPKKKKVKVKVIRQQAHYDDENEEDTLPPPPPPPGSPPPHIFPARIKEPVFNNIHSNILANITNPPIQTPDTSYPPPVFRPSAPVVISHHIPLHPPGPPPPVHRHHIPPLPTSVLHHGGFNQSTNLIPHGNHR